MPNEVQELISAANASADALQELANDITATIDTLPKNTSAGTQELLAQHARRCLALAAALRVEAREPEPHVTAHLVTAARRAAIAATFVLSSVIVGALEEAGSDLWNSIQSNVSAVLRQDLEIDEILLEPDEFELAALTNPEVIEGFINLRQPGGE